MTTKLDEKLARIRAGKYKRSDFILADAKDGDMGAGVLGAAPKRAPTARVSGARPASNSSTTSKLS